MPIRDDIQAKRNAITDQKRTAREKAMARAHDLEQRAQRCQSMAIQLQNEAMSAMVEAAVLRTIHRREP